MCGLLSQASGISIAMACGSEQPDCTKQLDSVVERHGVTTVGLDDREELRDIVVEIALEHLLAGVHPVDVALDRVDLAVMRHIVERLGRCQVGNVLVKQLVHETERAGDVGIGKLAVEIRDLRREQQAFVDDSARRKRGHGEHAAVGHVAGGDFHSDCACE